MPRSTDEQSTTPRIGDVDVRRRIRVVECYGILYCDNDEAQAAGTAKWKEGQLTYHKSDRKVYLFGPKNVRLEELFHITLEPPPPQGEDSESAKDLQSLLAKKPTLPIGHKFTLRKGRYDVCIDRVKFVHHNPYTAAGREDREKRDLNDSVRRLLDSAPDILAGVLPATTTASHSRTKRSASPPPQQRKHSRQALDVDDE